MCDLLKTGNRKSKVYKELSALHCVDYSEMPKELRNQIPTMINELLKDEESPNKIVDVALDGIFN